MANIRLLRDSLIMSCVLMSGGCATTSVTQTVEGMGPIGDRLLVKREKVTLTSSPWTGASIRSDAPEFFLCGGVAGTNDVECDRASVKVPGPK